MNTFKGTPGPWICEPINDENSVRIVGFNSSIIAKAYPQWDYTLSNAKLIAGAPQMAAALQEIIPLIEAAHKSAVNKAVYIPLEQSLATAKAALSAALD
jgi:hypothetical protein